MTIGTTQPDSTVVDAIDHPQASLISHIAAIVGGSVLHIFCFWGHLNLMCPQSSLGEIMFFSRHGRVRGVYTGRGAMSDVPTILHPPRQ